MTKMSNATLLWVPRHSFLQLSRLSLIYGIGFQHREMPGAADYSERVSASSMVFILDPLPSQFRDKIRSNCILRNHGERESYHRRI